MKKTAWAALLLVAMSASAGAATKADPAVNADTKESFAAVSEWVRKEMSAGGRYEHVTASERKTVDARLDEMAGLLDRYGSVAQMSEAEKTRMFNDQEEVNAILAKRDGDRMICKSVAPVGSHIPVKTCKTARQIAQEQRDARRFLEDRQNAQFRSSSD